MITPDEIVQKAERLFGKAVRAWMSGESDFFPYRMAADFKLPADHSELIRVTDVLRRNSKECVGAGYSVRWEERRSRAHGHNAFPVGIEIESLDDLAKLIRRHVELRRLRSAYEKLMARFPSLQSWVVRNWQRVLEVERELDGLMLVLEYLQQQPRPNCFARELPLPISTKLIDRHKSWLGECLDILLDPSSIDFGCSASDFEQRYGLKAVREHLLIRLLDATLLEELRFPATELSLTRESLHQLPVVDCDVVIVENKINLLTLPARPRTIALGGLGNGITQLFDIPWLKDARIFYWGDIDVEGFGILDRLRHRMNQVESLLMDRETLEKHAEFSTKGSGREWGSMSALTEDEQIMAAKCQNENIRLEQEHVLQCYVTERFQRLGQ